MAKGIVYTPGGGLRVRNGAYIVDDGIALMATAIQSLNGSTFSRIGEPTKYTAWKYAGFPGAKDGGFYASTNSIISSAISSRSPCSWSLNNFSNSSIACLPAM